MTLSVSSPEPLQVAAAPPPLRRDRMVQTYLGATVISAFGDTVFTIGLAWTAVHLVSPGLAGLVLGIELLPQAVCTLVGGVVADRFDTRSVMLAGAAARAAVLGLAAAAWQAGIHSVAVLFAVAVCFGAVAGLTNPAAATLMRQLVRGQDLVTVGGWLQTGTRLARLAGAPVGALVVQAGFAASMAIDAISFVAIGAVVSMVVRPRLRIARRTEQGWWQALQDGICYVRSSPVARQLILGLAVANVFVSPVMAVGLALRVSESRWGSGWLGAAESTFAAGAIVGSLLAVRWSDGQLARRGFAVLVLQGVGLARVGVPVQGWVLTSMGLIGVTAGLGSVWLGGLFQRIIPADRLGRASSVSQLGDQLLIPATMPLFGMLAARSTVLVATMAFGAAMSVLSLFFATRRSLWFD